MGLRIGNLEKVVPEPPRPTTDRNFIYCYPNRSDSHVTVATTISARSSAGFKAYAETCAHTVAHTRRVKYAKHSLCPDAVPTLFARRYITTLYPRSNPHRQPNQPTQPTPRAPLIRKSHPKTKARKIIPSAPPEPARQAFPSRHSRRVHAVCTAHSAHT